MKRVYKKIRAGNFFHYMPTEKTKIKNENIVYNKNVHSEKKSACILKNLFALSVFIIIYIILLILFYKG